MNVTEVEALVHVVVEVLAGLVFAITLVLAFVRFCKWTYARLKAAVRKCGMVTVVVFFIFGALLADSQNVTQEEKARLLGRAVSSEPVAGLTGEPNLVFEGEDPGGDIPDDAPLGGVEDLPRLMAGSDVPSDEPDPVGASGLQITEFAYQTNGVTIGSCWSPDLGLTGLGLFHSPFVNSNDWTTLEQWDVPHGSTNDVHAVPFGGALTNAAAGFFMLCGYPDPEMALYTTIEIVRLSPYGDGEVSVTYEDSLGTHVETFVLEVGATNVVPVRIGRRYTVSPVDSNRIAVRSDDPCVRFSEGEQFWLLDVCRPVRVLLTDRPPPEDATRCSVGHVHARYCDFATDPALTGELAFYDTKCISVDNSNRTLSVATSWAPGHRSANRIMEDYGALGTFTETNGTVDLVFDDLCPHSVGSAAYCLCGQSFYCPDCIGSTAAWYNLMFPDLLTATNAPDGSVSFSWHEGVASNAYYFVELTTTNRSIRATVTPRLTTMTRDYQVQTVAGLPARIPLLAGVAYTISVGYGDFTVTPEDDDVIVTPASARSFTVERPLTFGATWDVATELHCSAGHVHTRRYRVVTNIPDIPGTVEIDESKCIAAAGDGFAVTCNGVRGDGCAAEDVVTGRFIYEGVTKPFAITNSALCRCDDLHHPTCPCGAASLCDECDTTIYGQGADWVRMNFGKLRELDPDLDDADDILRYGYASWVDRRVGYGLENGLYKLTATFTNTPPGTVWLDVGELTVAVTNAGNYVFLLEKGVDYRFGTSPYYGGVRYQAKDDLGNLMMAGLSPVDDFGVWTVGGGRREWSLPTSSAYGRSLWMPRITATPDVGPLHSEDFPVTFTAILSDAPEDFEVAYEWQGSSAVRIASPSAPSTVVYGNFENHWIETTLSVTARLRGGSITSQLNFCFGDDDYTQPVFSVSAPEIVFLNDDDRISRWYRVRAALTCPVATNATVSFMNSQTTLPVYASDSSGANRIQLSDFALSTSPSSPVDSRTFYMACGKIGSGSVFASCALENGGTLTDSATYRVIEPIFRLVNNEIDSSYRRYVNPSRLVVGEPSTFRVGVAGGGLLDGEVDWQVVGPARYQIDGWNCVVTPTAAEPIAVCANFNDDVEQPAVVLPTVIKRVLPVKGFIVTHPTETAVDPDVFKYMITWANVVFRQVGIEFELVDTIHNVGTDEQWNLTYTKWADVGGERKQVLSDDAVSLLNTYTAGDCIEVYLVGSVKEVETPSSGFCAKSFWSRRGIVVQNDDFTSLPHELGHAFGLSDCYDCLGAGEVSNLHNPVDKDVFSHVDQDFYGGVSGRGFYSAQDTKEVVLRNLLMYGASGHGGTDIPFGAVRAFPDADTTAPVEEDVGVGVLYIHGSDSEVYSQ